MCAGLCRAGKSVCTRLGLFLIYHVESKIYTRKKTKKKAKKGKKKKPPKGVSKQINN
jgi:hypothetical protein